MVNPAETGHPKKLQDITPSEKIIESLTPTETPLSAPRKTPELIDSTIDDPVEVLPLTDDEIIPSAREVKVILGQTFIWMGALILVVAAWVFGVLMLARTPSRLPLEALDEGAMPAAPTVSAPAAPVAVKPKPVKRAPPQALRVPAPQAVEAVPQVVSEPIPAAVPVPELPVQPVPGNLKVRFDSPTMVVLNWDFVGDNYKYRLYSATSNSMADAQAETDQAITPPHMVWQPRRPTRDMWIAVSSIDSQGRESRMSAPVHINLPPEL